MALINCCECGHQVSDRANACPNCGNPIASPDHLKTVTVGPANTPVHVTTGEKDVVTTQATGKGPKMAQLLGVAMITLGIISCTAKEYDASKVLIVAGFIVYAIARMMGWWRHG